MITDTLERVAESTADSTDTDAAPKLNRDGTVKQKPGPKPGAVRKPRTAPAPGKAPAARKPAAGTVDYRPAIQGLAQIPQMVLGLVGRFLRKPALAADGLAIGIHAPGLAEALNETAKTEQNLARALDRLMQIGPYGLVVAAALPVVMQVLVNHGAAEASEQLGTYTPERLVELGTQAAGA